MRGSIYPALLCLALTPAALPTSAMARDGRPAFVPFGAEVDQPRGYADMCAADPALCNSFRPAKAPSVIVEPIAPEAQAVVPPAIAAPALGLPNLFAPEPLVPAGPPHAFGTSGFFSSILADSAYQIALAPAALRQRDRVNTSSLETIALASLRTPSAPGAPSRSERLAALLAGPTAGLATGLAPRPVSANPPSLPAAPASAQNGPDQLDEKALMKLLRQINGHVNRRVFQRTDTAIYGRPEVWRPSGDGRDATGDCEDIALEKRIQLLAAKFPADRLFMAVVYNMSAGLHAVLVARMPEGDMVLDSRLTYVVPWSRTDYDWLSVESPQNPDRWFEVRQTGT